ncbi:MAG TPA: hypothetical protein VKE51_38715 [Vicinamibacterales bacterium]|nr:hypothetical protein [Vicinamibacterales bacterium]
MALSTFGFSSPVQPGTPFPIPFGLSQSGAMGTNPFATTQPFGQSYGQSPFAQPPNPSQYVQQILQLIQTVPQQVQHLLHLEYLQQHQLQQLQQIVQLIPAQLAQLQQLIQSTPQQLQQFPQQLQQFQQQPFGQIAGPAGYTPWGVSPQAFGAQPGYVM